MVVWHGEAVHHVVANVRHVRLLRQRGFFARSFRGLSLLFLRSAGLLVCSAWRLHDKCMIPRVSNFGHTPLLSDIAETHVGADCHAPQRAFEECMGPSP